jgi:hypothetical protein
MDTEHIHFFFNDLQLIDRHSVEEEVDSGGKGCSHYWWEDA